jgi:MFS family permease
MGARSGFGVFVIPMSEDFGWNRGTISLAASIGALVSGLSQPFLGRVYDSLGGRKLILASLVVSGVRTVLLALTNHILFLISLAHPRRLEPVELRRDYGLFLVSDAAIDQCAHGRGLWPEASRHPQ